MFDRAAKELVLIDFDRAVRAQGQDDLRRDHEELLRAEIEEHLQR
jgi:hypothetical protein